MKEVEENENEKKKIIGNLFKHILSKQQACNWNLFVTRLSAFGQFDRQGDTILYYNELVPYD